MDKLGSENHASAMLTLSLLIDSFESHLEVSVRIGQTQPATKDFYTNQLKKLRKALGNFPAAELRAHHLTSITITNHFARAIKRLMKWAADEDQQLIPANRFAKLKVPPTGERTRILEPEEFQSLLRVSDPQFRQFLTLAGETAARPGELRKLRWDQVQITGRQILLTKFKARDRRRDGVKVRRIPLTKVAVRLLEVLLSRRAGSEYVFPDPELPEHPLNANTLRLRMARARKRAGLRAEGEKVVCYTLRHTRATELTNGGLGDNALADVLGHTNTQMTKRYQHLSSANLCKMIDQADAK